ncbi:TPA: helix-turn-helix transcriptional regulator [Vibrio parahaemolyticus]|nr:helix-turn-helix transcriptional regulator [Vibrio parahaemolyticus]
MRLIGNDVICESGQNLTDAERRVFLGLAEGETPTEIKNALKCDTMSLRNLEIRLMGKLGAKTKTHIVSRAFVLGLLFSRALCLMLALALSHPGDGSDDWTRIARGGRTTRTIRIRTTRDA